MIDKQKFMEIAEKDDQSESQYLLKSQISKQSKLYKTAMLCSLVGLISVGLGLIRMILFIIECMVLKIYNKTTKETPGFICMVFADILSGFGMACSGFHSAAYSMGCSMKEAIKNVIYITVFLLPFAILYPIALGLLGKENDSTLPYYDKTIIFLVFTEVVCAANYTVNAMYIRIASLGK
jgi:di/tricarboxylate transporter